MAELLHFVLGTLVFVIGMTVLTSIGAAWWHVLHCTECKKALSE